MNCSSFEIRGKIDLMESKRHLIASMDEDTEERKRTAAIKAMIAHANELRHKLNRSEHARRWEEIQRPIMEYFWFEGCEIETYNSELDEVAGHFLRWTGREYLVDIDVEDSETIDEVRYFCLTLRRGGFRDSEVYGTVKTIEDVKEICRLLQRGKCLEAHIEALRWDARDNRYQTDELILTRLRTAKGILGSA
jgi:hypothetical protein